MRGTALVLSCVLLAGSTRADDPELLAKNFVRLAETLTKLGGWANYQDYRTRQHRATALYRDFLTQHPESVYSNKIRWSLYSSYLATDKKPEASLVLDDIQDALIKELLQVAFARRAAGDQKRAGQLMEGLLAKTEDGGVKARLAEFLYVSGEFDRALAILDEVSTQAKYPDHVRARAMLITADLFRLRAPDDPTLLTKRAETLRTLSRTFPQTAAGLEGGRKLAAALLRDGSKALPFTVKTVDGRTITSAGLRGKVVLLYFFATWSYPSWRELETLKKEIDKAPGDSIQVIAAACEEYVDRPREFFATRGITWPLVAEGNKWRNSLARLYDVNKLPHFVLIDGKGLIVTTGTMRLVKLQAYLQSALMN